MKKLRLKRELLIPAGTLVSGLIIFTLVSVLFIHPGNQRTVQATKDPLYKMPYNSQNYGQPLSLLSKPLKTPVNLPTTQNTPSGVLTCKPPTLDLKILVLAGDGSEVDLPAIEQSLNYIGASYTVYTSSQSPGGLTEAKLDDGSCHAYYNGVILTTGLLTYYDGAQWRSGLSQTEWTTLWTFEAKFGVRSVSWYTFPTTDFGFQNAATATSTSSTPYAGSLTSAGASVFPYLNANQPFTIQNAYTYLDAPLTDGSTTPLIADGQGNALAAVHTYGDGRQLLALTFDSNPTLIHTITLSYGLINWVTRGLFIGQQGVYLQSQVDDIFIDDNTWAPGTVCGTPVDTTPTTYRITGSDFQTVVDWQKDKHTDPLYKNLKLDMVFNGYGTEPDAYPGDTLVKVAKRNQNQFIWTNHTYDHAEMDNVDASFVDSELLQNVTTAQQMHFANFTTTAMVTPSISGLRNPIFLNEAYADNIRYLVSDSSQADEDNPAPNEGIQNWVDPQILMVPRHPTNLFFNVSTPDEWVAEYNCLYHDFWGADLNYQQILDIESQTLLIDMITGNIDPEMYHQPNLRAYDGTHTLLGDLLDLTLNKYAALYNVPVQSLRLDNIGDYMANKTLLRNSGVVASVTGKTLTITTQNAATIPITGSVRRGDGYSVTSSGWVGGQKIAYVPLQAGQSISIPLN